MMFCRSSGIAESIEQTEELWRDFFEQGPAGFCIVDHDFNFLKANPAFCKLPGYSMEELTSLSFQDILHPSELASYLSASRG